MGLDPLTKVPGSVHDIQCSSFIPHLIILQLWVQHSYVMAPKFFFSWNFTKALFYPLLNTDSTQEDRKSFQHDRKIADWNEKHQHSTQTNKGIIGK